MDDSLLELLEQARAESGAPAVAGIVAGRDTIVAQAATGVRRLGDTPPVTLDDRFHIGSCAKAMTATLCALAVHRGQIGWHTTPQEAMADLAGSVHPDFATITLDMLLRHTAGIPPYTEEEDFVDLPDLSGPPAAQRATFARWLLAEGEPVVEPGSEVAYSNAGYCIAAAMIEATTGRAWEASLRDDLLIPLGIKGGIGWPARQDPRQPWGHWVQDGTLVPHTPDDEYELGPLLAPAGDVCVSLPHQARFLQMNLAGLQGIDTLLPAGFIQRLHNDGQPGIGLGWGVQVREGVGPFSGHIGGAGTFLFVEGIAHDGDRAVALAANAGDDPDGALEGAIVAGFKEIVARYT